MPGTLVSNSGLTTGISTPRLSVPNTSVMASAGQAVLHAPCPIQSVGLIRCDLPAMIPRTWCPGCSGQALTHDPHPRHLLWFIWGCRLVGSVSPALTAEPSTDRAALFFLAFMPAYSPQMTRRGARYIHMPGCDMILIDSSSCP